VLPDSCAASADCLAAQRAIYEERGIFAPSMIDGLIATLRKFDDRTLRADIGNDQKKILALVETYFHCG
jgi:glutamine synthetase